MDTTYCPVCPCQSCVSLREIASHRHQRHAAYRSGDYTVAAVLPRVRAYQSALAIPIQQPPAPLRRERRIPTRPLTMEEAVGVPMGGGAITATAGCIVAAIFAEALGYTGPPAVLGALGAGGVLGMATGGLLLYVNIRNTLGIEREWGIQAGGNAFEGQSDVESEEDPDNTRLWRYEIVREMGGGYKNLKYPRLPLSPDKLRIVAKGVLAGRPFSEREWASIINSKQFRQLRNELVGAELMTWKVDGAPQQGVTLTEEGRQFFTALIEEGARQWAQ